MKEESRKLRQFLMRLVQGAMARAFVKWRTEAEEMKEESRKLRQFLMGLVQGAMARAWLKWRLGDGWACYAEARASAGWLAYLCKCKSRGLTMWRRTVKHMLHASDSMNRGVSHQQKASQVAACAQWNAAAKHMMKQSSSIRRSTAHRTATTCHNWTRTAKHMLHASDSMNRGVSHQQKASQVAACAQWNAAAKHMMKESNSIRRSANHFDTVAWGKWTEALKYVVTARVISHIATATALKQLARRLQSVAWKLWKAAAKYSLDEAASLDRCAAHQFRVSQAHAWLQWTTQTVAEVLHEREIKSRALECWTRCAVRSCFSKFCNHYQSSLVVCAALLKRNLVGVRRGWRSWRHGAYWSHVRYRRFLCHKFSFPSLHAPLCHK